MSLDARVAALVEGGDVGRAATEAIQKLGPEVLGYLNALVRDEVDASDIFSQFAEDLWKSLPKFRGECSLRTWAYRLAWNAAGRFSRDAYRKRGRRLRSTEASRLADRIRASTVLRREWRSEKVAQLRARLDPEDQTLLILRLDRELPWREVAQVLAASNGVPLDEAALRKRFERIKDKLSRAAREEGLLD